MKNITFYRTLAIVFCCLLSAYTSKAQFAFTNSNSSLTTTSHSGCAVTVVDINNDGLDDIIKMDQSTTLMIDVQQTNGTYNHYALGTITGGGSRVWGMACADVDKNGWKDICTGTNGTLYLVKIFWSGTTLTQTTTTLTPSYFVQNVTFADFNNDGWIDIGVCDDVAYEKIYMNDGAGNVSIIARSTTANTISVGSKTFTTTAGLNFTTGQILLVGYSGAKYMTGTVTSYTGTTLVINVTSVVGSGSDSSWSIHPSVVFNTRISRALVYGTDPYDSGNYGSVWLDFDNDGDLDFYIAHCRQSTSSYTDIRRKDRLFVNDGNGHYTENSASLGIEIGTSPYRQTWTTSFGDIDNDGDFDLVLTNHGENGQVFTNNGSGVYTDITVASGFSTTVGGGMDPIESELEDFDNDGFLDILVTGGGGGDSYVLYHNNGNLTFTQVTSAFPTTTNGMLSFSTGDLNHDGKEDVFVSYGDVYNTPTTTADVYYANTIINSNHYITFNLTGTISNVDAIGARATIYGAFGKQIREVRAGDSYGNACTMQLHFGIGASTTIDSVRINWPSGLQTHLTNLVADQFVTIVEGGCSLTGNVLSGGPYNLCATQTQTISAQSGFSTYLWSVGGAVTQTVTATGAASGSYMVTVTNSAGCTNISPAVVVTLNNTGAPTIAVSGTIGSCPGTTTLTSSVGTTYLWTGPSGFTSSSASINAPEAGVYVVTTAGGVCGTVSSLPTTVSYLNTPSPTGTGAISPVPASLTISAVGTGGALSWYDMASAGSLLITGPSYTTPLISVPTTYYVEEAVPFSGLGGHTGQPNHTGTSLYNNGINGGLDFNVTTAGTLVSVKVITDSSSYGVRDIQLKNSGGTVINTVSVNIIADTTVVSLNIPLAVGNAYRITTDATVDNANFGAASPFLQRSTTGVAYPYSISGLISITNGWTGTATSTTAYYYFYDWVVSSPSSVCTSARTPVLADIGTTSVSGTTNNEGLQIYPNPAINEVNISFENTVASATIELTDVTGRLVKSIVIEKPSHEIKLNVNDVNAGTYFLTVKTDKNKIIQKLVITK